MNLIRQYLTIVLIIFSVDSVAQDKVYDDAYFDQVSFFLNYPGITAEAKVDSLYGAFRSDWRSYSEKEAERYEGLIQDKINKSKSLQSEFFFSWSLGRFHAYRSHVGSSNLLYQRCLDIADSLNSYLLKDKAYYVLSSLYYDHSMYDLTMQVCKDRILNAKLSGDTLTIKHSYSTAGWFFTNIGSDLNDDEIQDTAIFYLTESRKRVKEEYSGSYGEASIILSFALARGGRRQEAIDICRHCANNVFPGRSSYKYRFIEQIMLNHAYMDNKDSALFYLDVHNHAIHDYLDSTGAENMFIKPDGLFYTPHFTIYQLFMFEHFGMYKEGIALIEMVNSVDSIEVSPSYEYRHNNFLAKAYLNTGEYKKSAELYAWLIEANDSLAKQSNQMYLDAGVGYANAQIQIEQKRAKQIQNHQNEIAEKEAEIKRIVIAAFAVGSIALLIFLFLIFKRFKKSQEQKAIIEEQKKAVEQQRNEILDSIQYAKRIQKAILPPDHVIKESLPNSFVFYLPKDIVAGDFYWMHKTNDSILLAAADCTGHGVPGAMVSVVCNNGLNRSVREHHLTEPGEILDKTREIVIQEFEKSDDNVQDGMDICLVSISEEELKFAGAHNSLWVVRKDSEDLEEIKADKQPIGKYHQPFPFKTHHAKLSSGDRIYLFTDGFADQFGGEKGKKYKAKNFKKFIMSIQSEGINEQLKLIQNEFNSWKGNLEQLDDVCVIGIEI